MQSCGERMPSAMRSQGHGVVPGPSLHAGSDIKAATHAGAYDRHMEPPLKVKLGCGRRAALRLGRRQACMHIASERRPLEWLASSLTGAQPQRPVSPAPEAADFETDDEFLRERARWFREHGDGSELPGTTRREQNNFFQRLKDRLFGLRRDRANPSGTPRAVREGRM